MYKAVLIDPSSFPSLEPDERILAQAGVKFVFALCQSEDEIIAVAHDTDILMIVYRNFISRSILENLPDCKAIVRHGIGVDNIDVEAATDLGILVVNNPTYCIEEVSDMAIALLLACTRRIPLLDRAIRAGTWQNALARPGYRIRGSTLGLVGLGRIAQRAAEKAQGLGMAVLAYDPYISPQVAEQLGVALVPLDQLLQEADFISLHAPYTDQTRHLIGERELRMMKPNCYLINTARGPLVDTEALVRALDEGWIAGAGLDLIEDVPPMPDDHPLLRFDTVVLTPHAAWYSEEATIELQETCARDAVRVLHGEMPTSLVNPQVLASPECRVPALRR
jgi:D-3-phosphoglycerate dehydrogenase